VEVGLASPGPPEKYGERSSVGEEKTEQKMDNAKQQFFLGR
jgi:hypothetical protein